MIAMSNTPSVSPVHPARLDFPVAEAQANRLRIAPESRPLEAARADQVEISADALSLEAQQGRDVRHDLVARIRSEIASGKYITEDKVNKAIDGLLTDLEG